MKRLIFFLSVISAFWFSNQAAMAQCTSADIMEPGFNFITSSRGCAPFEIQIQTLYLNSTPGTIYHVDWGDGSSTEDFIQMNSYPDGPIITHEYADAPIECGYQVIVQVENPCNAIGSVVLEPINVIVWTEDIITSDPDVYRVCQGFASNISFSDISDWNCFPRADPRENADPRWIQWVYGDAGNANRITGIQVDGISPAGFPYLNPDPGFNPKYPVTDADQVSLGIQIPITAPTEIGKDFYVTLNNWNTCNAYDEDLTNGTLNPVTAGGDNPPRVNQSRIVIVETPSPDFESKKENNSNPVTYDFCIGDIIYFDNITPTPDGANLNYSWEFYDGPTVADGLLETKSNNSPVFSYGTGGHKLVRLIVGDINAIGSCTALVEKVVRITPTAIAQIGTANTSFCKTPGSSEIFTVIFTDETVGSISGVDEWRWELFDENGNPLQSIPATGYSSDSKISIEQDYTKPGVYLARLIYRDIVTQCETEDEINIVVYNNPEPSFSSIPVCEGLTSELVNETSLDMINGNQVVRWEWDFDYDNVMFSPDSIFDGARPDTLKKTLNFGVNQIALRATNDQNGCNAIYTDGVEVFQKPIATFIKDSSEGCSPLTVIFDNTAVTTQPVAIDEYIWSIDYGSGYVDTLHTDPDAVDFTSSFTTTFENWSKSSKSYNIILKAISKDGCAFNSSPDFVKVMPSVKPGFNYIDYNPLESNCAPVEVNFQVDAYTRSLLPTMYTWTVRSKDGEVVMSKKINADSSHLMYSFPAEGKGINTYTVNLKAELADICVSDSTLSLNVNPMPTSDFTIDTLEIDCNMMLLEVNAVQKGLLEYKWTINKDGMIINDNTSGDKFSYKVSRPLAESPGSDLSFDLQTSNYAFCESDTSSISILVPAKPNLLASFLANPEIQVFPNSTVTINNTSTRSDAIHSWDFGDGTTSSDELPEAHRYETPGNYTIKLHLEEDYCVSIDSVNIYIQPTAPVADFSFDTAKGCAPLTVNFTNLSKYGNPEAYRWYFGEGEGISNSENPTHVYYEPGIYSVKLEATNETGVTDAAVKPSIIEVFVVPHADFTVRPETVKLPDDPIHLTNLSFEADSYYWEFGDGGNSIDFEPTHTYLDTGKYDIMLIAKTEKGCMDTVVYENIVEVIDGNEIQIPNAFTPNLDGPTGGSRYGNGRNDVFYPVTEGVIAYKMQIYNRWGELLFDTEDRSKGWDGYYNGKVCTPDVYIYKIDFKFIDGREIMKFGDVTLIR